jgi:hypothetical protein
VHAAFVVILVGRLSRRQYRFLVEFITPEFFRQ